MHERLTRDGWAPPWIRHQHVTRYEWAATMASGCIVLDAACGTGYGARILRAGGARRVVGIDLAPEAIEAARKEVPDEAVAFEQASITSLPVPSASQDLLLCLEAIEHLEDEHLFLREAVRVLKPEGRFICSTPNRTLADPGTSLTDSPFNPFHKREYTRCEFEALLQPYFHSVVLLGQSHYRQRYVRTLNAVGRAWPALAVKLHQARKLVGIPFENASWHRPTPIPEGREPETLIALCSQPIG